MRWRLSLRISWSRIRDGAAARPEGSFNEEPHPTANGNRLCPGAFKVTPGVARCTSDAKCRERATHRLLVRSPASATLMCDEHVLDWTSLNGYAVTTAVRTDDSAA